jgi:hypothetical protein
MSGSRSTVRILKEAHRLLQDLYPKDESEMEAVDYNVEELQWLIDRIHRKYPIAREDD